MSKPYLLAPPFSFSPFHHPLCVCSPLSSHPAVASFPTSSVSAPLPPSILAPPAVAPRPSLPTRSSTPLVLSQPTLHQAPLHLPCMLLSSLAPSGLPVTQPDMHGWKGGRGEVFGPKRHFRLAATARKHRPRCLRFTVRFPKSLGPRPNHIALLTTKNSLRELKFIEPAFKPWPHVHMTKYSALVLEFHTEFLEPPKPLKHAKSSVK